MKVLIIDNKDSFTYNILELVRRVVPGDDVVICPVGLLDLHEAFKYHRVIISPGPGLPRDYPALFRFLKRYGSKKRILGVCLGYQAICCHFGARLYNLSGVVHGQPRQIRVVDGEALLFRGMDTLEAGLYHSWAVVRDSLPAELKVTAVSYDGVVMGVRHHQWDLHGVQFHPESYITSHGMQLIKQFIYG